MDGTIMVVDDETRIRRIYAEFLRAANFSVLEAESADQANELVKRRKVDLVLLDLKMPEVEGDTFFEILHAFHRETKVIVTSVYPLEKQKQLVKEAGDFYDKSQGISVLLKKISHILSKN